MKAYLNRQTRDEIADVLIDVHNHWVRFRDKQPKHPARGANINRWVAESRIRTLTRLIAAVAPGKLVYKEPVKP